MDYLIGVGADREEGRLRPEDLVARAMWQLGGVGLILREQSGIYASPEPDGAGPTAYVAVARVSCARGADAVFDGARRIMATTTGGGLWVRPLAAWSGCHPDQITAAIAAARAARGQDVSVDVLPVPGLDDHAGLLVAMSEIAPDWRHPLQGRTAAELAAMRKTAGVARVGDQRQLGDGRDAAE